MNYWLILICALTGDQTRILRALGQHSNQLSYSARATKSFLLIRTCGELVQHADKILYLYTDYGTANLQKRKDHKCPVQSQNDTDLQRWKYEEDGARLVSKLHHFHTTS